MTCHSTVYKLFLIVLVSVLIPSLLAQHAWFVGYRPLHKRYWRNSLDCTKYVFAPRCRGAAAKRSYDPSIRSNSALPQLSMEDLILQSFSTQMREAEGQDQARGQLNQFRNSGLIQPDYLDQPLDQGQNLQEQEDSVSSLLPALLPRTSAHKGEGRL